MAVGESNRSDLQFVSGFNSRLILVSGPARSGKSRWAEHLLHDHPVVTYIATAAADRMISIGRTVFKLTVSVVHDTGALLNLKEHWWS